MSLKLFLVVDGDDTKYWVGAHTQDEAVSLVEEDIDRGSWDEEDKNYFLHGMIIKELDAIKETIYDEEESETISFEKCFKQNNNEKAYMLVVNGVRKEIYV